MNVRQHSLGDDLSVAFTRACRERDFAVADHLLSALEIIASREDEPGRLERAYLELAHWMCPQPDRSPAHMRHAVAIELQ